MNHIEEMMKTAGVKKCEHFRQYNYAQVPYGKEELKKSQDNGIECIRIRNCTDENNTCIYWTELFYPSFTAEKQLKLINLIRLNDCNIAIYTRPNNHIAISTQPHAFKLSYNASAFKFEEALAQLTTQLISAGELDKEKVKEVLQ